MSIPSKHYALEDTISVADTGYDLAEAVTVDAANTEQVLNYKRSQQNTATGNAKRPLETTVTEGAGTTI
ncbi:hypothetical protein BBP40_000961 [Aspergillus hancockii]|nr:hypothetical protein BBP40_000961 [Aspergillus hancockii]